MSNTELRLRRERHATDSSSADPVTIAVVGLGYWGPNLVRVAHELPEFELAYVCDLELPALEKTARRYPGVAAVTDMEQVLRDDEVEAVVIATPVSTHRPLVSAALSAGKHVFVEKPLAASGRDAQELVDHAAARDLVLMPGHTFLYSPPVNVVRDLFVRQELGDIYFISTSRVNLGLHQSDVSVVWDLAPHDFSILSYWLGESPLNVSARSRSCIIPDIADVAFIDLEYPSGTVAHVEISWLAPSKLRRTAVVGSRKMVVYDDTSNEPVRIFDSGVVPQNPETYGEYRLAYRSGDIVSPQIDAAEPLTLELRDFYSAVRNGGEPRSSATLGMEVVRMLEAVDRSLENGGAVIPLDDPSIDPPAA